MPRFSDFDLCEPVIRALKAEGYETPTPVQAQAIPPALEGRDLLAVADTGTGKTAAFALPVLDYLFAERTSQSKRGVRAPGALILSPTRELATQIAQSFKTYGMHTRLCGAVVVGGVSQHPQVARLQKGVDILVATPGRLMDLMDQGLVDLSEIDVFVLDEADRMLDMGFIHPIRQIASALHEDRQTMLFSATMPKAIAQLAADLLVDPVGIAIEPDRSAKPLIDESLYKINKKDKPALLSHLLQQGGVTRSVVFSRTKHGADRITKRLTRDGVDAVSIHGNKTQNQRRRALDAFKTGRAAVLVATDVAARGLDVDDVSHVFNFDMPNEPETYIHRIGRTGRAGAEGVAVSFCDNDERGYLKDIERLTGSTISRVALPEELEIAVPKEIADKPAEKPRRGRGGRPARQSQGNRGQKPRAKSGGKPTGPKPKSKKAPGKKKRPRRQQARA
ncbi:MAG: DEAD/DEAH box helicase [Planctomycetota bacterium]